MGTMITLDEVADSECTTPRDAATAVASSDMSEIEDTISSVRNTIAELQSSMQSLRADNHVLRMKHRTLEQENGRLRRSIEETKYSQEWDNFDAVEEHYRQLERSRTFTCDFDVEECSTDVKGSIILEATTGSDADGSTSEEDLARCDADFAAGVPPRKTPLAERRPEKLVIRKLSLPLSGDAAPVLSSRGSPICRDISSPKNSSRVRRPVIGAPFLNGLFSDRAISKPILRAPRW